MNTIEAYFLTFLPFRGNFFPKTAEQANEMPLLSFFRVIPYCYWPYRSWPKPFHNVWIEVMFAKRYQSTKFATKGYVTIYPPVANFMRCICQNYESWLAVDKVIEIIFLGVKQRKVTDNTVLLKRMNRIGVHVYTHARRNTQVRREVFVVLWTDEPTEPATEAPDDKCSSDEFTCGDGTCIPLSQRCDWTEYHCPDGTDEFHCRTLTFILHSSAVFVNCMCPRMFYNKYLSKKRFI